MSSKKPVFTSLPLDKLVDESIAEADQLEEDLKNIDVNQLMLNENDDNFDDYIEESDKNWSEVSNVIDNKTGESVSFTYVYKKICDLIDTGNAALQMLQTIDLDVTDPMMIRSTATLMTTIKDCISEFTKIHQQWIKFNQTMKLEEKRLENKKELIKFKHDLINGTTEQPQQANELVEVTTSDLVEFIKWQKERKEKELERENKI